MNKKLLVKLGFIALTFVTLSTGVASASPNKSEIILAQESGMNWIQTHSTKQGFEQWLKAELQNPQILSDINGRPNAFMFSVKASNFTGHMIIGNSGYRYSVFEVGATPPPTIPDVYTAKTVINKDLNTAIANIPNPSRLLYVGFHNIFAVYDLPDKVGINLYSTYAINVSKLKPSIPSPQEYFISQQKTEKAKPLTLLSEYYTLTMWAYQIGEAWCGPSASTSIGQYYKYIKGYSNLTTTSSMYGEFLDLSDEGVIWETEFGPFFLEVANNHGYSNFSHANDWIPTSGDYWNRVSDIDNGWPIGLEADDFKDDLGGNGTWPPDSAHWVAIKGYEYPSHGVQHAIICTDSFSGDSWLWLDWDNITYTTMFTCTIKDS